MNKKRLTAEERRTQIVKVAMRLFSMRGFKGTTTREIAERAKISEATIFKHFAKKEHLYSAIIDMQCNDREGQSLLIKRLEGKDGREAFMAIALFLLQTHQKDPTFMKLLMFSALEGHKVSDIFIKTRGLETLDYLAGYIAKLMKDRSQESGVRSQKTGGSRQETVGRKQYAVGSCCLLLTAYSLLFFILLTEVHAEEKTITLQDACRSAISTYESLMLSQEDLYQAEKGIDKAVSQLLPSITADGNYIKY